MLLENVSKLFLKKPWFLLGLLALSAEENKTIDEAPYLTPEEKAERKEGNVFAVVEFLANV